MKKLYTFIGTMAAAILFIYFWGSVLMRVIAELF